MGIRRKLGMRRIGEGPNSNVMAEFEVLGGASAAAMGAVKGLMYHPGQSNSCSDGFGGIFVNADTLAGIVVHLYEPWYWSDFIVTIQDLIALTSNVYSSCNMDKLLLTITRLISIEGVTAIIGRASGMIYFEFKDLEDAIANPFSTDADIGFQAGRSFAALMKYHI